jgi:hypothetical protein
MACVNPQTLDLHQFRTAVAGAIHHFSRFRQKHPVLKAYLVLSLPGVQTKADSSLDEMLKEMPALLSDGDAKSRMTEFLRNARPEASRLEETAIWNARFQDLTIPLEFKATVQAELRFQNLDHPLIWKLQSDELIARHLTPQTKASIRIVLGTLSHFAGITPTHP